MLAGLFLIAVIFTVYVGLMCLAYAINPEWWDA